MKRLACALLEVATRRFRRGIRKEARAAMSAAAVTEHLLRGHEAPPATRRSVDICVLRPLAGTYRAMTRRFEWEGDVLKEIEVGLTGGSLCLRYPSDRRLPLVPVTERHFRHPPEPVATMAFVEQDGALYLHGDFGSYRHTEAPAEATGHEPPTGKG